MGVVHFVHPGDLATSTGGYRYARSLLAALQRRGLTAIVHRLADSFPFPDRQALAGAGRVLAGIADDSAVIIDGLALGAMPQEAAAHAARLKLIALVHHPLALETGLRPAEVTQLEASERAALASVRAVVVTSPATAETLQARYGVAASRITVVVPGIERASGGAPSMAVPPDPAASPASGAQPVMRLLCVASITPRKGHVDLVQALAVCARNPRLAWRLTCVGSLARDPACAAALRERIGSLGLAGQVELVGERDEAGVDRAYEAADVFVLASYHEGYGMVLAEALAHGLPVVSTTAGAIPHTVPPQAGLLVPPGDTGALAEALERVMADSALRASLAAAARLAAAGLPDWDAAATLVLRVLASVQEAGGSPRTDALVFSAAWLALREPADHAARAPALTRALVRFLQEAPPSPGLRILDLACGSGSTLRYLAPRLGGRQHWKMVDRDATLLALLPQACHPGRAAASAATAEAAQTADSAQTAEVPVTLEPVLLDLADDLSRLPLVGIQLITASALLDLVSADWLDRLVVRLRSTTAEAAAAAARGAPETVPQPALLFALNYDGSMNWRPQLPDDAWVTALFNRHQRSDKGFGPALGAAAAAEATVRLRAAGYRVMQASSPWRVGSGQLHRELLTGIAAGAGAMAGAASPRVRDWLERRMAAVSTGTATVEVGHRDLLALPDSRSG